jgi:hypothetical protein
MEVTEFRRPPWFILEVDSAPGSLHGMDVVSVSDVSEAHAGLSKEEASVVGECQETHEEKGEGWCAAFASGDSRQGNVIENGPIKSHRELQRSISNWSSQAQ